MTVLAVYICMVDRIAISIAIIPMAEDNGWSPTVQGAVMSAFFLGYVTLQIPAGYLSDRFGGKWVLYNQSRLRLKTFRLFQNE